MKTIAVAPHPDDEILGVGGTLLRRKAEGGEVAWLVITGISADAGWPEDQVKQRAVEMERVSEIFSFDEVYTLNFPTTRLDTLPMGDLVAQISNALKSFEPDEIFVPHPSDVHSDHRIVFDAVASSTKWIRSPFVKRILAYETLSETEFGLGVTQSFRPNVFVDINDYLEEKLRAMDVYESEQGEFPFPRSHEVIRALAALRGAASGYRAAEAFELLRDRS